MSRLFDYFGIVVKSGEHLFREGEKADVLYMIHKGKVEIYRQSGNIRKTLQILGEGEFVGEMAVIDSLPRSANAMAAEECHLIKMDKDSFDKSIRENHQFSISVIQFLTKRIRDTNDKVVHLARENIHNKIIMEIYREMLEEGKKDQTGELILISFDRLVERLESTFSMGSKKLISLLYEIMEEKLFILKKDKRKNLWLAYRKIPA